MSSQTQYARNAYLKPSSSSFYPAALTCLPNEQDLFSSRLSHPGLEVWHHQKIPLQLLVTIFKVCLLTLILPLWPCGVLSHFSCLRLCVTLWTVDSRAPLSMGFSRQGDSSELPCPSPGDLPNPGIEPMSFTSPALVGRFYCLGSPSS